MSTFRGQDGSVTFGSSVAFDELLSWGLDGVSIDIIEDTVKGDTVKTYKGALADGGTITVTGRLDYTTAQEDVMDLINAGTGDPIAFELLVATGKKFTGNCIPQSYSVESPEGSAIDPITFVAKVTGAVGKTWG